MSLHSKPGDPKIASAFSPAANGGQTEIQTVCTNLTREHCMLHNIVCIHVFSLLQGHSESLSTSADWQEARRGFCWGRHVSFCIDMVFCLKLKFKEVRWPPRPAELEHSSSNVIPGHSSPPHTGILVWMVRWLGAWPPPWSLWLFKARFWLLGLGYLILSAQLVPLISASPGVLENKLPTPAWPYGGPRGQIRLPLLSHKGGTWALVSF